MRVSHILILLALAAACSPGPPSGGGRDSTPQAPAGAPLEGTTWRLAEIGGRPVAGTADSARPSLHLVRDTRKVQGSAGCNRMMGSYELSGASLKFGPLMATKMACPSMETEQAFLAALDSTIRYEINGSSLTLYGPNGALARLEKVER
jgi:heat shock protein HslJ